MRETKVHTRRRRCHCTRERCRCIWRVMRCGQTWGSKECRGGDRSCIALHTNVGERERERERVREREIERERQRERDKDASPTNHNVSGTNRSGRQPLLTIRNTDIRRAGIDLHVKCLVAGSHVDGHVPERQLCPVAAQLCTSAVRERDDSIISHSRGSPSGRCGSARALARRVHRAGAMRGAGCANRPSRRAADSAGAFCA